MRLMLKKWELGITLAVVSAPVMVLALLITPTNVLAQSGSVSFSLDPPTIDVGPGEVVPVSVKVDASSQPIDTVQVFLDFDPSLLQVVDDSGKPASQVSFGPVISNGEWKQPLLNQVDNSSGRIGLAAGKGLPSGGGVDMDREFVLAVINFKAVGDGAEAPVTIDLESQDSPLRSKALSKGMEVTGKGTGATINITAGAVDNPSASAPAPMNNAGPSIAGDSSIQDQSTSSSDTAGVAPTPAAAVVTAPAPEQPEAKATSTSPATPADNSNSGLGTIVLVAIIGGVAVLGLIVFGVVLFLRSRRSSPLAQSRAIPLGPARG